MERNGRERKEKPGKESESTQRLEIKLQAHKSPNSPTISNESALLRRSAAGREEEGGSREGGREQYHDCTLPLRAQTSPSLTVVVLVRQRIHLSGKRVHKRGKDLVIFARTNAGRKGSAHKPLELASDAP